MGGSKRQLEEEYEWLESHERQRAILFQASYEDLQARMRMEYLCRATRYTMLAHSLDERIVQFVLGIR